MQTCSPLLLSDCRLMLILPLSNKAVARLYFYKKPKVNTKRM